MSASKLVSSLGRGVPAVAAVTALVLLVACAGPSTESEDADDDGAGGNTLLAEWTGPYGGVPAFDRMELAELEPALQTGMERQLSEIDAIAADPAAPTFANTIAAMERAGKDFERVMTFWSIWSGNLSTPEFREVQQEMAPKLAEFQSKITQNQALFQRIRAVYEGEEMATLSPTSSASCG